MNTMNIYIYIYILVHSKHFMIITIEKAKNAKVGINNEMGELMKPNQFSRKDALLVEYEEMEFDHLQLLLPWSPKKYLGYVW